MKIVSKTAFSLIIAASMALLGACSKKQADPSADAESAETSSEPTPTLDPRLSYLANKDIKPAAQRELLDIASHYPEARKTPSGLHYVVIEPGQGDATPTTGQTVVAHYTGSLLNGEQFDSSRDRNQPFRFAVGRRNVIAGWDEAFLTMKKGERRTLIIPSYLAYGNRRQGPIPANSTLVFEVELLDFN